MMSQRGKNKLSTTRARSLMIMNPSILPSKGYIVPWFGV
jgi:hypothetical protein